MKVPFLDLSAQRQPIHDELMSAIEAVVEKNAFAGGPFVQTFETNFASLCNVSDCIGVGSGTEALWLAMLAFDIGPGDEVITVPNTFIATAEAISYCGATPVFVDIDEKTYNMNPELLEAAITSKTKAIVPVHLYGQTADMDPILSIAKKHGLIVIEDACQAHGATYKGKPAGSIGDAGCFSFYPGKNLGAYGEAGAVTTNNQAIADKIRILRDHGQTKKYHHDVVGWNGRMDGIQGAVLDVKLKYLNQWTEARRQNAFLYNELLSALDVVTPFEADDMKHVYHVYSIRTPKRDELLAFLQENDVACGIHYPVPLHLTGAYAFLGKKEGAFPMVENVAPELLSLPMFAELQKVQIERVVDTINMFLNT